MSWGAQLVGMDAVLDVFEDVRMRYDGNTVYVVGPTVKYAIYQDQGTSSIEARPFVKPAAERVQQNFGDRVGRFLDTDEPSEEAVVRAAALAVEREMKRVVEEKDIWDTGDLHGSITTARVQ